MNMEIRSNRKKKKKMDTEEETESIASNKAVRSKTKMKKKMITHLTHLFAGRSAIKKMKMMNKEEAEAFASNKAVRSKRKMKKKKKKMNKEETEAVALRTSNQVKNYLNHDIIISILSKLPSKSFKRFECVCKSWSTLFQDSFFKTIYTNYLISNNNNHYDHTYLALEHELRRGYFYLLPGQRFQDRVKIHLPSPFQRDKNGIDILGAASINGILCLNQRSRRRLVLWNPTTGEFKVIPYGLCEYLPPDRQPAYDLHGFGYDHVTNDYKVIQFVDSYLDDEETEDFAPEEFVPEDRSSYETFWMIYSLRSNSWRKLDLNIPNRYYYTNSRLIGAYANGVCHWWARTDDQDSEEPEDAEEYLLSFDFSKELMFTTPWPSYLDLRRLVSFKCVDRCLVVLNESIALISNDLEMATIDISILGELGVRESWTKLLTIMCSPSIEYPIGVGNLSNTVLFIKNDNKLAWIDLNTKMMEDLDIKLMSDVSFVYVGKYKKSFLPIGGMNN